MTRKERKQREVRINIIAQEHVEAREHIEKINELKEESRGCSLRALFWGLVAALMAVTALLHAFSLDYPELNSKLKIIEEL